MRIPEAAEFGAASSWSTGHCPCTPDSPVNYSAPALRIPKGAKFRMKFPGAPDNVRWCTGHCPVAHRTVRCARPGCLRLSLGSFV
jgi:hypothetical protein